MLTIILPFQKKYVIKYFSFSWRTMHEAMVSVVQRLFIVDEGNWLFTSEKLKKLYASVHTEPGLLLLEFMLSR